MGGLVLSRTILQLFSLNCFIIKKCLWHQCCGRLGMPSLLFCVLTKFGQNPLHLISANEEYYQLMMINDNHPSGLDVSSYTIEEIDSITSEYTLKNNVRQSPFFCFLELNLCRSLIFYVIFANRTFSQWQCPWAQERLSIYLTRLPPSLTAKEMCSRTLSLWSS